MKKIELWTDGACRGNGFNATKSGIGGVILIPDHEPFYFKERLSFAPNTNNKSEIYAVIKGLTLLEEQYPYTHENFGDELIIYSDSAYLINGITSWINGWRINNWMNSKKEPVKNQELWKILDELLDDFKKKYNVSFKKVRGHSGIYWNEVCDKLANEAMDGI